MSCLICNELILIITCGLITCVSLYATLLVHLMLSLNYPNQKRTFHSCKRHHISSTFPSLSEQLKNDAIHRRLHAQCVLHPKAKHSSLQCINLHIALGALLSVFNHQALRGIPEDIDCRQGRAGIRMRRCKEHKDLDRFRPPERNTLRPVWWFVLP